MALSFFTGIVFLAERSNAAKALAAILFVAPSMLIVSQTPASPAHQDSGPIPAQIPGEVPTKTPVQPGSVVQPKPQKRLGPACVSAEEAAQQPQKEVCVNAHVFDVVELPDGTRFLDICPFDLPDEQCRFTFLALPADREEVGDLRRYRDQDVSVRGIVRVTHGRMGIVISHARQFSGGPEKFRPNPKLLRDFNPQSDRMPVRDSNLTPSGRHRSFMNTRDRDVLPQPDKH